MTASYEPATKAANLATAATRVRRPRAAGHLCSTKIRPPACRNGQNLFTADAGCVQTVRLSLPTITCGEICFDSELSGRHCRTRGISIYK
jgi:hypothetical protein